VRVESDLGLPRCRALARLLRAVALTRSWNMVPLPVGFDRGAQAPQNMHLTRHAEIVDSPILGEAASGTLETSTPGSGQRSLEGGHAELMPGTRDEQSRWQHARIALSTSGHRAGESAAAIPVAKRDVMILRGRDAYESTEPAAPDPL
jgi:hypothetical protein